jgi:DNA processing protein
MGIAATKQKSWLIALRAPHLGGAKLVRLAEKFGGMDRLIATSGGDLRRAGLSEETIHALVNHDEDLLQSDLEWLAAPSHHLITWESERYPPLLREIPSPPPALYAKGDPDVLWQPQVAVIGSRNPTAGGKDNAKDFSTELCNQGMTITSGLACGIDSIAHAAALDAGGHTVAVTGTGLDRVYPASSRALAERVQSRGVLVSEFPPGTAPKKSHFPARNRIISGLSLGVLVVEAGLRSGTLITARLAGVQGREVFALPGSIHNPMAKGCHRLIREGAKLVENVSEIVQELSSTAGQLADALERELGSDGAEMGQPELEFSSSKPQFDDDPEYQQLWSCIGFDPKSVDSIIAQSGLTARAVSAMLLMLELRGMVEVHPGRTYSRKKRG